MKKKIDIFSGFLGAGKTKLIKKLINEKFYTEKIAIIENEFGEVGIDGRFLEEYDIQIKEINAACICCSNLADFKKALQEISDDSQIERIIIEPSGVGKLSEILKTIKELEISTDISLNLIITVVDVTMFEDFKELFGEFYENQIAFAETIVLSRTQSTSKEDIEKVVSEIKAINYNANIITTPWDDLKIDDITKLIGKKDHFQLLKKKSLNLDLQKKIKFKIRKNNAAADIFASWSIEISKIFTVEKLKYIFNELKNEQLYGKVIRSKGIVQVEENAWIEYDYLPKEFEIRDKLSNFTGGICVIGTNLNKENLKKLFL